MTYPRRALVVSVIALAIASPAQPQNLDAGDLFGIANQILRLEQQKKRQREQARQERLRREQIRRNQAIQTQRQRNAAQSPPRQPVQPAPSAAEIAAREARRAEVREVQDALNRLGYEAGPVDGIAGRKTRAALSAFERDNALPVDGQIDPEALVALRTAMRYATGAPAAPYPDPIPGYSEITGAMRADAGTAVADAQAAPAGLRVPAPVMRGERILTGAPVMHGPFAQTETELDGRTVQKASLDLALLVDLQVLKRFPEILEDEAIAAQFAARFLEEPLRGRYYARCVYPACRSDNAYASWVGATEFDRAARYRAFREEIAPQLIALAREAPLRTVDIEEVELGQYDSVAEAFPLRANRPRTGYFGFVQGITTRGSAPDAKTPESLPMPPDAARRLVALFGPGKRHVYLAYEQDVGPVTMSPHGRFNTDLPIRATRIRVYRDALGDEILHDFGPIGAGAATGGPAGTLELRDGLVWLGDRLVVSGTQVPPDPALPVAGNLARAVTKRIEGAIDYAALGDETVIGMIGRFSDDERRAIASEALQRPVSNAEFAQFRDLTSRREPFSSPFVRFRLANAIRTRLTASQTEAGAGASTLPLRVYCRANAAAYDFDRQAFGLRYHSCDDSIFGVVQAVREVGGALSMAPLLERGQVFPQSLSMPMDRAEAFAEAGQSGFFVSFETAAEIGVRGSEAGPIVTVAFSDPGDFVAHDGQSWTDMAFPFAAPAAQSAAREGPWRAREDADLDAIAALVGAPKALPFDAGKLGAGAEAPLGQLIVPQYDSIFGHDNPDGTRVRLLAARAVRANQQAGQLATALGVPPDRLINLSYVSRDEPVLALLPAPAESFAIEVPADRYGRPRLSAHTVLDIASVHRFALPGGGSVAVAVATPVGAMITEHGDAPVIERFTLAPVAPAPAATAGRIETPPRAELVRRIATAFGVDPGPIMEYTMAHPSGLSELEKRSRFEELMAQTADQAESGAPDYWLVGTARIGDYDFDAEAFPVADLRVGFPELQRALELKGNAIRTLFLDREMALPMPRADAEAFEAGLPRDRGLPVRLRVRPVMAMKSTYGNLDVQAAVAEAEFLEAGADPVLREAGAVLARLGTAEAADPAPRARLSRAEARAHLVEMLGEETGLVVFRRGDLESVERVFVAGDVGNDYHYTVRDAALDLPKPEPLAQPAKVIEAMRGAQGAVYVLRGRDLFAPDRPNMITYATQIRPALIALAQEMDVVIEPFPPEPDVAAVAAVSDFDTLVAGDPEIVVLRRRGETGPAVQAFRPRTPAFAWSEVLSTYRAAETAAELGFTATPELPRDAVVGDLLEVVEGFRATPGAVLALPPAELEKVFSRLAEEDLVGRAFPLEELYVGLAKDHTRTAADFQLLGVSGGMARAEAMAALQAGFGALDESAEARLGAGGAGCITGIGPVPGSAEQAGSRCMAVTLAEDAVVQARVWQVIAGDAVEPVTKALKDRFGWTPFMQELRHLEGAGQRMALGWGTVIGADRAALGRVDAKFPPTAVEAVIWRAGGVTTVLVQLDAAPEATAVSEAPAKIEF